MASDHAALASKKRGMAHSVSAAVETSNVKYHDVDSYQSLLTIMNNL